MAKSNLNTGLTDIRGKISDWIYREQRGRTVISKVTNKPLREPTPGQQQVRDQFKTAAGYASLVMTDPVLRPIYERAAKEQDKPIFALALADYYKSPVVTLIKSDGYTGKVGDKIVVAASDDIEVASVTVVLRHTDDTVIEQGKTVKVGNGWEYTATTVVPVGQAIKIEATAKDHPGNEGMLQRPITVSSGP